MIDQRHPRVVEPDQDADSYSGSLRGRSRTRRQAPRRDRDLMPKLSFSVRHATVLR
ncbi:MAG: hypothetical protein ACLQU5_29040 [Isosphaeraceae bacterium]